MVPRSQLIYRYLQIAVSMTVDMHLDSDPSIAARHATVRADGGSLQSNCGSPLTRYGEAYRAALGCFYMSSV